MLRILLFLFLFASGCFAIGQTGPGGVGSTSSNVLWLKADSAVYSDAGTTLATNNQTVRHWQDQSGNGDHANQSTVGSRPTYLTNILNGYPVLRFASGGDGSDYMQSLGVNSDDEATVFIVARYTSLASSNPGLLQASPSGQSLSGTATNKTVGVWVAQGTGSVWGRGVETDNDQRNISQVVNLAVNTYYIVTTRFSDSDGDGQQWVNGAASGTTTMNNNLKSWVDVCIGAQAGSETWNGDIAEVIMYNEGVNTAQRIIIENYLAAKYGITLSANDLYDEDNAGNGNYDHEVAGIGRVNATNVNNEAKGTDIVTVNDPSGMGNNEYVIWGHNNGVGQAIEFSDVPSGVVARMDRVWRASVTGTFTSFDVSFDLTGLGSVTASDLRLLIDANGVFASGATVISGAINDGGNIYRFNNVSAITDNMRFTLGTINASQTPLPVELTIFSARAVGEQVDLSWATATETNNDYFMVQHAVNGTDWSDLATVDGQGNATTRTEYAFTHSNPVHGQNYYRLAQVDIDGTTTFSKAEQVMIGKPQRAVVFPNPAQEVVHVIAIAPMERIEVVDYRGVNVVTVQADKQSFVTIPTEGIPAGFYVLRIYYADGRDEDVFPLGVQ